MLSIVRRIRAVASSGGRPRAGDAVSAAASPMRTMAALGLAAALLFLGLTIVALRGGGDDGGTAEVLGAKAGPTGPSPSGAGGDVMEVASTDGGAFFVYAEDPKANIAGSATVIVQGEGDVTLTVGGEPKGDRAVIKATVQNGTTQSIVFPDGLTIVVDILRDGQPWRTVEPSDQSVTQLLPGETATVTTEVALEGFGEYELTGEVAFARR